MHDDDRPSIGGFFRWIFGCPLRAFRAWRKAVKESKDQDVDNQW